MTTALLVMDVQRRILDGFPDHTDYLDTVAAALAHARSTGVPVVHVVNGFRRGHPEVHPANATFGGLRGTDVFTADDAGAEIHPAVAPVGGEPVVTKHRISAFAGSDLAVVLRTLGATHLVRAGLVTSGVVLSTLREAADLDFTLTVLSDGCMDRDEEVQRVLTVKLFPRQGTVTTVREWTTVRVGTSAP